jgi:hypothetical protein
MNITVKVSSTPKNTEFKINLDDLEVSKEEWEGFTTEEKKLKFRDYLAYTTNQPQWEVESFN